MISNSIEELIIVSLCDFQSRLSPFVLPPSLHGTGRGKPVGGLARVAGYLKRQRVEHPGNLLAVTLGADTTGPLYHHFEGRAEYECLAQAGFDATVLGEHELELGRNHFRRSLQYVVKPLLCANLQPVGGRPAIWTEQLVLDLPAMRVGLFGLSTPPLSDSYAEGPCLESLGGMEDTARRQVESLLGQGCRAVIALTHMGLENDKELAGKVAGLHAVLGAHSHAPTPEPEWVAGPDGGLVPVVQALGGGAALGRLRLCFNRGRLEPDRCRWSLALMSEEVEEDHGTAAVVGRYMNRLQEILRQPVAELVRPLAAEQRDLLAGQAALGYLIADALRQAGQSEVGLFAAPEIMPGPGLSAGPLCRADLYRLLPFGNTVWEVDLPGRDLSELVAGSLRARGGVSGGQDAENLEAACFLYFSGLRIQDGPQPAIEVEREGAWRPLEEERRYRVAAPFMLRFGDRHCQALARAPGRNLGLQEVEALASLLEKASPVEPPNLAGRWLQNQPVLRPC